ncbi:MFS monocarboxylate transporter-like protein [Amylocarpus encephaloides]|uniref:MFS monocarboxylate transporter-like protein n=1 Tax=Amylocarpus encephaloides TaxID=45428 RepID=A0A9P7YK43_9HELO|nr:MFS monocarboxylate transporter-like protein [Amylocarpus encephaloides]
MVAQVPTLATDTSGAVSPAEDCESKVVVAQTGISVSDNLLEQLPPDGGFLAWVQCGSSFSLYFISWGLVSTFGQFQSYYEITFPDYTPSQISWIGSIEAFFLIGLGVVAGPIYDYGYMKSLVRVGCFLCFLGMILMSFSTKYWHFILSQGVVLGIGSGCVFIPSIAVLPSYFSKNRALAMGIGASGSAIGGIVFPIMFYQLQPQIGFAWTTRIMGLIMLLFSIPPITGMRVLTPPKTVRRIFDTSALTEIPFLVSCVFFLLLFMGSYIPPFYIQSYGRQTITGNLSHYLLPFINFGSLVGKIIPPYFADRFGSFNVQTICVLLCGILSFTWITVYNTPALVTFSFFYGFFSGAMTSLCANVQVALAPNFGVLGVRLGMGFLPMAAGLLIGAPIAGSIHSDGFIPLKALTGALLIAALLVLVCLRVMVYGWSLRTKC